MRFCSSISTWYIMKNKYEFGIMSLAICTGYFTTNCTSQFQKKSHFKHVPVEIKSDFAARRLRHQSFQFLNVSIENDDQIC